MHTESIRPHHWIAVAIVLSILLPAATASRSGASPGLNGSPASGGFSCVLCHDKAVGNGSVQLLNAPATYKPNSIYDIIVRVSDPDQEGAGFQISAEDPNGMHQGTLIVTDAKNTGFQGKLGWLTHTDEGVDNAVANWAAMGNSAEYQLRWQAPASDVGPVTFYMAGNAINDNNNFNGDTIYLGTHTTVVCAEDTDGNGAVDVDDLVAVILDWGTDGSASNGDVNDSGVVDVDDLVDVILAWGDC